MLEEEFNTYIEDKQDNPVLRAVSKADPFYPTTRYYGSKKRLIDWISSSIESLNYSSALDIFGGTATVSLLFKSLNKKVTYNDILLSNNLQATAILSNKPSNNIVKNIEVFCDDVISERHFITKYFEDTFYTNEENEWLDGAVRSLSKIIDPLTRAEIFYCLQQACIQKRPFNLFHRKNLYLRTNNNKETKFGNWATWEKPFKVLMLRAAIELQKARWKSMNEPIILPCTDAFEINNEYDLIYLDPPYIPKDRQDISYLERYHFLEGLAAPDTWQSRIDQSKASKAFIKPDVIKNWNTKSTFKENLFELINKHKSSNVVLSYVDNAHPPLEEIQKFFKEKFKYNEIYQKPLSHALSAKTKTEVLFIGKP